MRQFIRFVIPILFALTSFHVQAQGGASQTKDDLERKQKQIQQEIEELRQFQNDIKKNKKTSLSELKLVQARLRKRTAAIENINDQIQLINNNIFQNNREIYRLRKELDTLKAQYGKTVEYAYKNRSNYDMLNFIFSSASFNDAIKRIAYLKSYRNYREQQVANIMRTQDLLQNKTTALSENKKQKSTILIVQTKQREVLEDERKEKDEVVSKLKSREKEVERELLVKKKTERDLKNAIAAIIRRIAAEEDAKAKALAKANSATKAPNTSTSKTSTETKKRAASVLESTPEAVKLSENFESNRGKLPWPVEKGKITEQFGRQFDNELRIWTDNIGITIATNIGQNVKAVFNGKVASVNDIGGNWAVTIRHGKYLTTYNNLASVSVTKGDEVSTGQSIGKAGENTDGDGEINFVVNNGPTFINPESWIIRK